jgi:phage terminase large subunit GpA-like protein
MRTGSELAYDIADLIRPGEKILPSEAAKKYLKVKSKSGGAEDWNPELTPYLIEPLNCLASRDYDAVIFIGSAQCGKTAGLVLGGMAYSIKSSKSDFMVVQTTKDTASQFERKELGWTIRNSPELKKQMQTGSRSDNTFVKEFKNGQLMFISWPTVNQLSGKALQFICMTDYDRMDAIDGEGSIFKLSQKRTTTFLSKGMSLAETSPSGKITDPTWRATNDNPHEAPPCESQGLSLYNMGDRRRFYVQCPECGDYYMPPFDQSGLDFPIEQDLFGVTVSKLIRKPKFVCTVNGCLIDTKHKRQMIASGKWLKEGEVIIDGHIIGKPIEHQTHLSEDEVVSSTRIASFWLPGIFAAYSNPEKMAQAFLDGLREYDITGTEDTLQAVLNLDFGAPYLSRQRVAEYNAGDYEKRAEIFQEKSVPLGVRFMITSIDVQSWGFSVLVTGYGVHHERWIIDRYELRLSDRMQDDRYLNMKPSVYLEDWLVIKDKIMNATYPLSDGSGRTMKMLATGSDSNGEAGVTERAYDFWRVLRKLRLNQKFFLLKGERPKPGIYKPKVRKSYPEKQNARDTKGANAKKEIPIWIVNTTMIKDTLSSDLKKDKHAPRYIHFPSWLPSSAYEELTVEYRDDIIGWIQPKGKKNELFDQLGYAEAIVSAILLEERKKDLDWDNPPLWAETWDKNSHIITVEQQKTDTQLKATPQAKQTDLLDTTMKPKHINNDWINQSGDWL